jgi:hypothetical protein
MLKLNASYSKKVPVQGEDYSSQSYHASVEVELSDKLEATDIQQKIHETFTLVRDAVETELHGSAQPAQPARTAQPSVRVLPQQQRQEHAGNDRVATKASNRQIKYILDLAKEQHMGLSDVNARCKEQFGVGSVYALDRKAASQFVDELKAAA